MASGKKPGKRGPKPKAEITLPQRRTLDQIQRYCRQHGFAPTIKELAGLLGISTAAVHEQLDQLVRKGFIERTKGKNRGLAVLRKPQPVRLVPIPLVGTVAAGRPILAEEDLIGEVLVEEELSRGESHFGLVVEGESMKLAGIGNGDVVIVRRQPLAEDGDIVVALVDGEATVKRLYLKDHVLELRPDSHFQKKYRPIAIGPETDLRIIGKVVAVRARGPTPASG